MASTEITIPTPPAGLPPELQEKWKKLYIAGYRESQESRGSKLAPDRMALLEHHHAGLREANRIQHVDMPQTYEEAIALQGWQLLTRKVVPANVTGRGDELAGVTIDGKKFSFPVPEKKK
jgi:hypothetical protein